MKKALFFILPFLIIPQKIYGESITTGNASAKSDVRTEVQGDANVYTKIEVEANGEKRTLETNEPGTHELKVESKSNNSTATSSVEISNEATNGADKKDKKEGRNDGMTIPVIQKIFEAISGLVKKIIASLGL